MKCTINFKYAHFYSIGLQAKFYLEHYNWLLR